MGDALEEGVDYVIDEQGRFVFTREYHLKRGYCCGNNCKNCPYEYERVDKGTSGIKEPEVPKSRT